jgi:hypothetical protein
MRARVKAGVAPAKTTQAGGPAKNRHYAFGPIFAAALLMAMVLVPASASARQTHLQLGNLGSAAEPVFPNAGASSLAVEQSTGDLVVIDSKAATVSRYHSDGTPHNFSALGTNVIDAKGGGKCATVPADCDQTPQNQFVFGVFPGEEQIAIDESAGATAGNIYVTQGAQAAGNLIDVFASTGKYLGQITAAGTAAFGSLASFPFSPCGVAVDGSGNLFVGAGYDNKIYKFVPTANPPLNSDHTATFSSLERPCHLAAGAGSSAGSIFANTFFAFNGASAFKLSSVSGAVQYAIDPNEMRLVSVDPGTGHVYVAGTGLPTTVSEYDTSGANPVLISTFSSFGRLRGIAVDGSNGHIYTGGGTNEINVFGPLVTVPDVTTGTAAITGDTSATVNGIVDPDGIELDECTFEYGKTGAPYEHSAPCAETPGDIGLTVKTVHADLSGLAGETVYHYRLAATNPNATINGADRTFKTPAKPAITAQWANNVVFTEATLKANINPENAVTKFRVEWGLTDSYGNETTEKTVAPVADATEHSVGVFLDDLEHGTTYHYRFVAVNSIGVAEGGDRTFITYMPSAANSNCPNQAFRYPSLPDCRAYEMVSPVDKEGGEITARLSARSHPAELNQSAADGERLAYSSEKAFGDAVSAPYTSQYIATRASDTGWSTHAISPTRESTSLSANATIKFDVEFKAFTADLCKAWILHNTDPALVPGAPEGILNLYQRDNCGDESYSALTSVAPEEENSGYWPGLQGFSEDGSSSFFVADGKLTSDADDGGNFQLYESASDGLHLVSVMPSGKASKLPSAAGAGSITSQESREYIVSRAISADGSRVFWSSGGPGQSLYLRANPSEAESEHLLGTATGTGNLSGPATATGTLTSAFKTITDVVNKAGAFSVGQEVTGEGIPAGTTITAVETNKLKISKSATLTKSGVEITGVPSKTVSGLSTETGSFAIGQEVFGGGIQEGTTIIAASPTSLTLSLPASETEVAGEIEASSECTKASKACTIPIAGSALFWGADKDGNAVVYTVGEKLYEFDVAAGEAHLIAEGAAGVMGISEDGHRIYFVSDEALDEGAAAGQPNLYVDEDGAVSFIATLASADLNTNLPFLTVSKDPSKLTARVSPDGRHLVFTSSASLTGYDNLDAVTGEPNAEVYLFDAVAAKLACISCNPSGARPNGRRFPGANKAVMRVAAKPPVWENQVYSPHALADDGARVFFDSYEALLPADTNGKADVYQWERAEAGDCEVGGATYVESSGGCLSLISTGQSPSDSEFIDASGDGRDVFFRTASSLLPQDPGLLDIYDARVEGGFPPEPSPPAACEGEACQGLPSSPDDISPASAAFQGAGNVAGEATKTSACKKGKVRRKGRCVIKKHKRVKRAHHNRRAGR